MTILEDIYASGGTDLIINTIELNCEAWGGTKVYICSGFEDQALTTEEPVTATFRATGMAVALPARDSTLVQSLTFALSNVRGEATALLNAARAARAQVNLIFRAFREGDKSAPAEAPYHMVVKTFNAQGANVEIVAGFFDLLDTRWPRLMYSSEFSPQIKYMS